MAAWMYREEWLWKKACLSRGLAPISFCQARASFHRWPQMVKQHEGQMFLGQHQ